MYILRNILSLLPPRVLAPLLLLHLVHLQCYAMLCTCHHCHACTSLFNNSLSHLGIHACRYNYRLTRPPQGGEIGNYILAQSPSIVNQSMSDSVTVTFPALTNVWTLTVQRVNGWYPSWYWPLIAAVIVVAFVLSVLLGLVLVSWCSWQTV